MTDLTTRIKRLERLLGMVVPVPAEWVGGTAAGAVVSQGGSGLQCLPCTSYATLVNAWRKAVKWFPGADHALAVMLATSFSTEFVGEQSWFLIIAPPSSLKTTLLEGLAVCSEYVLSKDSIRGLHDGWKDEDGEDKSLIALARGKTLAIKDGDTLLKSPDLPRVLSEFRGAYDKVSRTHYRNHKIADYTGHRMTVLICGTSALHEIDESELGTRFLNCVLMDRIDDDFEDDVGLRAVHQEARNMLRLSDGKPESQHPEELVAAMQLTGGYVKWLREHAAGLSAEVVLDDATLRAIARLGKFTAYMRARPPRTQADALSDRELSARLNKLFVRLAVSLAAVTNKAGDDPEVLSRVRQIALDTSRGSSLNVVRALHQAGAEGSSAGALAVRTNQTEDKCKTFLRFLQHHGIVDARTVKVGQHNQQTRWVLTDRVRQLYERVGTDASSK